MTAPGRFHCSKLLLGKGFSLTSPQPHEETHQSFVSVQKTCLQGVEAESTVTEHKKGKKKRGKEIKLRTIGRGVRKRRRGKGNRTEDRFAVVWCFLQFLYIPAAS